MKHLHLLLFVANSATLSLASPVPHNGRLPRNIGSLASTNTVSTLPRSPQTVTPSDLGEGVTNSPELSIGEDNGSFQIGDGPPSLDFGDTTEDWEFVLSKPAAGAHFATPDEQKRYKECRDGSKGTTSKSNIFLPSVEAC